MSVWLPGDIFKALFDNDVFYRHHIPMRVSRVVDKQVGLFDITMMTPRSYRFFRAQLPRKRAMLQRNTSAWRAIDVHGNLLKPWRVGMQFVAVFPVSIGASDKRARVNVAQVVHKHDAEAEQTIIQYFDVRMLTGPTRGRVYRAYQRSDFSTNTESWTEIVPEHAEKDDDVGQK